jgi:cyclopropane-fatty-acyl-phospholipid synthase
MSGWAITLAERGLLPDTLVRAGIRSLVQQRLQEISATDTALGAELKTQFIAQMHNSPIAPVPELANQQHYEVPAAFFQYCLGEHRKYSSCYWDDSTQNLNQAEVLGLQLTCQHADLHDHQRILELGCGWGSLTLWMAQHYPNSQITAVSNSNSQREYINKQAQSRGYRNVRVITCDMNQFQPASFGIDMGFDRVVSVEMFEHMRNYARLYAQIHDWLVPGGRFFKHIFVHRLTPYAFEVAGDDDWMSQYFFSGGIMPSDDLPLHFQQKLKFLQQWRWDGRHYQKTANAWLANMDANKNAITPILADCYGTTEVERWRNRWRMFYMACAELFGWNQGQDWWVSHYLFERPLT